MLKEVSVRNFRNLNIRKLEFYSGFTILVGGNGQGKTNVLEALYCLSYGKSFRGLGTQAINWQENEARVFGRTDNESIEIFISRDQENKILINGKTKAIPALLGRFVSVIFHPQEIELIFGPPILRRSWLDRTIATVDKTYLHALLNYQKALQHKNKLLKTGAGQDAEIEAWNKSLSAHGTKIWQVRKGTVDAINQQLKGVATQLAGRQIFLEYKNPLVGKDTAAAESSYLKTLASQRELERRFLVTLFGPHRDDFKVVAEEKSEKNILQKELANFGSRAEQRQAAILLKLTEARLFAKFFGKAPTLLLDDIASELDSRNRGLLLEHLFGGQYIITTTALDSLPAAVRDKARILVIRNGEIADS